VSDAWRQTGRTLAFKTLPAVRRKNFQERTVAGLPEKNEAGCFRNLLLYVGEY